MAEPNTRIYVVGLGLLNKTYKVITAVRREVDTIAEQVLRQTSEALARVEEI